MHSILVSPDITAFPGCRTNGRFYEGFVDVLQGSNSFRQQLVCGGVRDTEVEALRDAERDAAFLIQLWRHKVTIPGGRGS